MDTDRPDLWPEAVPMWLKPPPDEQPQPQQQPADQKGATQ